MGLSKKILGKLNTFIEQHNIVSSNNAKKNHQGSHNSTNVEDPSKIFYSIIDNSDNINETSKEYPLLKKTEGSFHKINSRKTNYSNNLSIEDELYDEFNYLLDE